MILFSFDLETTGLDFIKDRPIEVGAILYSTGQHKCIESQGMLVKSDVPVTKEITRITGITQQAVDKFGWDTDEAFNIIMFYLDSCDAVIGHNAKRFDKRMLENWADREQVKIPEKLWIDTYTDLPDTESTKLTYMAASCKKPFINMFPHSALADCQTVIKLIDDYDINAIIERAKSPNVIVRAHQSRDQNDLAKKAKFRWYPDKKWWWKSVKEIDLETFAKDLQFDISVHRENIEEFQDL